MVCVQWSGIKEEIKFSYSPSSVYTNFFLNHTQIEVMEGISRVFDRKKGGRLNINFFLLITFHFFPSKCCKRGLSHFYFGKSFGWSLSLFIFTTKRRLNFSQNLEQFLFHSQKLLLFEVSFGNIYMENFECFSKRMNK